MYIKVINIANICINTFKKLENINTIIALINAINSSYINKSSNNSRIKSLYLLKF